MSQKTSYAIFLSFMALFAALAANAKEPAAAERAAVLAAIHDQAAYAKALEAYDRRLTHVFAPTPVKGVVAKAKIKAKKKAVRPKAIAQATPLKAEPPKPVDAVMATLNAQLQGVYNDCLKSNPKECCTPLLDHGAIPASCRESSPAPSRGLASDSTAAAIEEATAQSDAAATTISSSAM